MRASEFVREVKLGPGGTVDTQQYGSSTVDQRGPGLSLSRDERGRPIEPGLEQPLFGPEDIIGLGAPLITKTLGKAAQAGARKIEPTILGLDPRRPKVDNVFTPLNRSSYGQAPDPIAGRFPSVDKDITHAQRQISGAELADLNKKGYSVANPGSGSHIGTGNEKWWSYADKEGRFGRNEFPGQTTDATVRVPLHKLPKGRAASIKDIEIQDPDTGIWGKLK